MAIMREFREFAAKGNVVEMGTGIAVGVAFTTVVNSLVTDILNPFVSLFTGGIDLTNLYVNLGDAEYASLAEAQAAGAPTLNYGLFLDNFLTFLIVAWVIFLLVKQYNRLMQGIEKLRSSAEPGSQSKVLLTEIRDLLQRDSRAPD